MYDKPLSYSGKSTWDKCPRLWHDAYVLGNRQEAGAAAQRGTYYHSLLEDFFLGKIPYPSADKVLAPWQAFMEELSTKQPTAEGELAVNRDWEPTGFDSPTAYYRGKKDLDYVEGDTLHLLDWKTGKEYDTHRAQGKTYVCLSPLAPKYHVRFVYLDMPLHVAEWKYDQDDAVVGRVQLTTEIENIRNASEYPATPSEFNCKWCHLSWRKGGTCHAAP